MSILLNNKSNEVSKYMEKLLRHEPSHLELIMGVSPCCICGQPIMDDGSDKPGYICEYIIPEYLLMMLTGLPNRLYEQEYHTLLKQISTSNQAGYKIIDNEYKEIDIKRF